MKNCDLRFAERGLFVLAASVGIAILAACGRGEDRAAKNNDPIKPQLKLVVPEHGAYTGAYIDFGEREDEVTLETIEDFEREVGKHQAIVAFSSYWGESRFPVQASQIVTEHHAVPLIYWSPWDWPYHEVDEAGPPLPDTFSLDKILAGFCNPYLDAWADEAKKLNVPIFVSLCNEANGNWFPWSAVFYGGDLLIPGSNPPRYVGPEYFKSVYRYIVNRVRARGATNILWVLQLNNYSEPFAPWNAFAQFYPGDEYADWLGLSVYGQQFPDDPKWEEFEDMMDQPYEELCRLHPTKPVMAVEWGVGEFPSSGNKAAWLTDGFKLMQSKYPRLHAAVYWHERWQNQKTLLYSNLKVNSSPAALEAYRRGVAASFWIGTPIWQ